MDTLWNKIRERKKEIRKKKEINDRLIEDGIIRDIKAIFEKQEKDYYKPKRVSNFWNKIIILNMKVMVIKRENYHQTNVLRKLNLTCGI